MGRTVLTSARSDHQALLTCKRWISFAAVICLQMFLPSWDPWISSSVRSTVDVLCQPRIHPSALPGSTLTKKALAVEGIRCLRGPERVTTTDSEESLMNEPDDERAARPQQDQYGSKP